MSRRSFIALVPLLLVAGCAKSLGPASPPFGSGALGYSDRALDGGLFEVQAVAPTQASAEKTFETRAKQLCRGSYRLKDDEDIRDMTLTYLPCMAKPGCRPPHVTIVGRIECI